MGAWDTGLLDNDGALDAIGDLTDELATTAIAAGNRQLQPDDAARLCARLAVIVEYRADLFAKPRGAQLRAIVVDNRATIDQIAPAAKPLLDALAAGADPSKLGGATTLLRDPRAHGVLQKLADQLVENIEDDLEDPAAGAFLHVLDFVSPYVELPGKTLRHWLRRLRELAADADADDEQPLRAQTRAVKKLVADLDDDDDASEDDGD